MRSETAPGAAGMHGAGPNRYFDPYFKIEAVKLLPGEYYATRRGRLLVTVLGSCVSVCLRDRESGIGGMNHFMLPESLEGADSVVGKGARYGVNAMEILINQLLKLGARRSALEAKVFGGGHVLKGFGAGSVGHRNASFAVRFLRGENIPILAQDLLGDYPRKIYFFNDTGRVLMKCLGTMRNNTLIEREIDYYHHVNRDDLTQEVELFS